MPSLRYRLGLLLAMGTLPGCFLTEGTRVERSQAEQAIRQHARDLAMGKGWAEPPPTAEPPFLPPPPPVTHVTLRPRPSGVAPSGGPLQQTAWTQPVRPPRERSPSILNVPSGLPGANAPPLSMLRFEFLGMTFELENEKGRAARLFPPLPPLPAAPALAPGPEGRPLSLADLERLGVQYSPAIKKAEAAVQAAIGAVKDAGAYPNPTTGYEHDTVRTAVAGYEGFFLEQLIKTAGKLKLKQAAALMDLRNAEVALRRAKTDVLYAIRTNYFEVLVARESARVNRALAQFAENIYRAQINLLGGRISAGYEPMQLRPLVYQARFNLVQARALDLSNWRQLAAALGLPNMPPTELAGRVDMPVPNFDYDRVLGHILTWHTDVLSAENTIRQGQYNLALEKVNPIPDVDVRLLLQRDYTNQPFNQISPSLVAGIQLPVWDQNKGKIWQARSTLAQGVANLEVTRNTLVNNLADAHYRYQIYRLQVAVSLRQVEDQLRVYVGIHQRRNRDPLSVSFGDLVTAQQTLATYIAGYVTALGLQWQAVTDVANLIQSDNLYDEGHPVEGPSIPGRPGVPCPPGQPLRPSSVPVPLPAPRPLDGAPRQLMPPNGPRKDGRPYPGYE